MRKSAHCSQRLIKQTKMLHNNPNAISARQENGSAQSPIRVNAHNEWDPLEEVVVGIIDNARFPRKDHVLKTDIALETNQSIHDDIEIPDIPDFVIEETREDLDIFAGEMEKMGITVHRPGVIDTQRKVASPFWETEQFYNYCPRDVLMTVGDMIIESANIFPSRYFEAYAYRDLLLRCLEGGSRWIAAPRPRLRAIDCNTDARVKAILNTADPAFDAANVIKAGKDLFYLISSSGNEAGLKWLRNTLRGEYRVHACPGLYTGMHIDTTITLLRPGLVLVNPERVNEDNLPEPLKKWDVIYAPEMEEYAYSDLPPLCSAWLGLNLFMINPNLAVVDAHQKALIKLLEKHKIDVLPLKLRHGSPLGGGFHCVTLDIRRRGGKEDYFS